MSTRTTWWSVARSSSIDPHTRPVWVKPWAITRRGPWPTVSAYRILSFIGVGSVMGVGSVAVMDTGPVMGTGPVNGGA